MLVKIKLLTEIDRPEIHHLHAFSPTEQIAFDCSACVSFKKYARNVNAQQQISWPQNTSGTKFLKRGAIGARGARRFFLGSASGLYDVFS